VTFCTPEFLIFLSIVLSTYWMLSRKAQNVLLTVASLIFYGWWDWRFVFLLLFASGVDFVAAWRMAATDRPETRRALLLASLFVNLGTLAFFKYCNFFIDSAYSVLREFGVTGPVPVLGVILPVGVSFYTFQALSYTIDVYRRRMHVVYDPIQYLSFITFFPQLVAGPIERASHMVDQFGKERRFSWELVSDGLRQMLWGFFKKMVVADNLASIVSAAYNNPAGASGWELAWATYAFSIQIYCDFSGYTDIAIGCARLLGFDLMRNFAYPYFSQDIREFWRRWHISLSTWFRDYLYIPLGGNRGSAWFTNRNIMIVFLVSGFWHGANWTYIIWGLLHGLFFLLLPATSAGASPDDVPGGTGVLPAPRTFLRMVWTFHLAWFAWIFFRAADAQQAFQIIAKIAGAPWEGGFTPPPKSMLAYSGLLLLVEWMGRSGQHALQGLKLWPQPIRWATYYAVVALILFAAQLSYVPFIYFQF
jgi:alginate O-acetyltransferase complex protein AlgI